MFTTYLNELQMLEAHAQEDSDIRVKFAAATSSETGSSSSQLVYFTLEPGTTTGRHSHSAEETLLVLEGTLEVLVGDERQQLSTGA